jgi:hypothetical protein
MLSTYEEIDAEWEVLTAETSKPFPPDCKAVVTAAMQHSAGLAIRAPCVHCGGLLKVTLLDLGHQGSAPLIVCPCGRSKNFLKVDEPKR